MARPPIHKSLVAALAVLSLACTDAATPPSPGVGTIQINASTAGPAQDSDGYRIMVDGHEALSIGVVGSYLIENVATGTRSVSIEDVADNCLSDVEDRVVTVLPNARTIVDVNVTCVSGPVSDVGILRITTVTIGPERDDDGYVAHIGSVSLPPERLDVPPNGSATIALRAGTWYFIALGATSRPIAGSRTT